MEKITFLISHIPNPRILKRIKTLENEYDISLIYWDRLQKEKETFEVNPKVKVFPLKIKAPQGIPIKRIIPLARYMYKSIEKLKFEKPKIIHAANLDMLFIARYYQVLYNRNLKIVYEVADLPRYSFVEKIKSFKDIIFKVLQKIEKQLTKKISLLILTSPYFWEVYFSSFIDKDKYLFIPNAPYKKLFSTYKKRDNKIFTIGFIGSVRYTEQLKMLIDAVAEIDKNINVFIAGGGPGYEEILKYSRGKDYVENYGPYNYEKEIVSLYEKVDLTYSVYNTELDNVRIALPNRLYESIVCEIPIIASKGTALGEFIKKESIGMTVKHDSSEDLKEELLKVIQSKEQMKLYQENCMDIKENYYYENNEEKLKNRYEKL